jgi:hypothetical protein
MAGSSDYGSKEPLLWVNLHNKREICLRGGSKQLI